MVLSMSDQLNSSENHFSRGLVADNGCTFALLSKTHWPLNIAAQAIFDYVTSLSVCTLIK